MDNQSSWYNDINKQLGQLIVTLDNRSYKKYKIDMLKCLAKRIEQFSSECGQCQMYKQDVVTLVQDVSSISLIPSKESLKLYFRSMNRIIGHLQKEHKLVTEGYYTGICMPLGAGIGVAIGTAMEYIGSGIPIGVGIGVAIGAALDYKARKENRILCPRRDNIRAISKRNYLFISILIALLLAGILVFILFYRSI